MTGKGKNILIVLVRFEAFCASDPWLCLCGSACECFCREQFHSLLHLKVAWNPQMAVNCCLGGALGSPAGCIDGTAAIPIPSLKVPAASPASIEIRCVLRCGIKSRIFSVLVQGIFILFLINTSFHLLENFDYVCA